VPHYLWAYFISLCWQALLSIMSGGRIIFFPSQVTIPANQKVKLIIDNQDNTPEEFDIFLLNREKVILANNKASIFIGPLKPGKYDFFAEYNPNTTSGTVIVEHQKQESPDANEYGYFIFT
jgi:hypothetical protein